MDPLRTEIRTPYAGLPPLDTSGPATSFFEFWPQHLFYPPLCVYWIWLAVRYGGATLPTISNPTFPFGGWIGESKDKIFEQAGAQARHHIAPWCGVINTADLTAADAMKSISAAGITLPCIAKPDMGCRGTGVRRIHNADELSDYLSNYPKGEKIIFQKLADHEAEAGIFYVRKPSEPTGKIISITLKYFPYVYGDGVSTLETLIKSDWRAGKLQHIYLPRHKDRLNWVVPRGQPFRIAYAGSHSRGTIFRNGTSYVTPAMTAAFDKIAKDIKEFYFGRFDIRFASLEALQKGEDFTIVEINGAGAEATHIWDRNTTLWQAYQALAQQYALLWEIGAENAKRGFKPSRIQDLYAAYKHETKLWAEYPLTD